MKKLIIIVVVLAAIGVGAGAYYMNRAPKEPEVKTAQVTRGDIVDVVPATGTLEAVTTVQVGTQVGGIIQELYADFNDDREERARSSRGSTRRCCRRNIEQQRANVTRAEADLERLESRAGRLEAEARAREGPVRQAACCRAPSSRRRRSPCDPRKRRSSRRKPG